MSDERSDDKVVTRVDDMRQHMDETAQSLSRELRAIAARLDRIGDKLEREFGDIRAEMRRGFAETQAMLDFSRKPDDRPN